MTEQKNDDTYECAMCHGTFGYAWTDEEAEAERQEKYPSFPQDQCDIVCDDCFHRVDDAVAAQGLPR